MKKVYCAFAISVILFSCGGEKKQIQQVLHEKKVDKLFTEAYMFSYDSIDAALKRISKDQVTKGKQLFMRGLDLYVNQKKISESIRLFRESILYFPDSKTYNYLANAYVDLGDTITSDSALIFNYGPQDYETSYVSARISALKKDTSRAIETLRYAFQSGFTNKKRLENDKCFDAIRGTRGFVSMLVEYVNDEKKLKEILYKSFLASFTETKFPFEMLKDSLRISNLGTVGHNSFINYDFSPFIPGMEDSRFSRDVSNVYIAVSKFKVNDNISAVLYKSVMAIVDTLPPTQIKIALFDSLGTLTEEKTFAEFTLPYTLTTGLLEDNGTITTREHKITWKNEPTDEGYAGNEWMGEELQRETKYKISEDGHFIEVKPGVDVAKK
ncbi:MAG TPA: hypothetical protein VNY73_04405 [Bacteroidia bacterium]|jgi:hypothetical protein|nr:hypothetical protein [Bacteroidia bacterium]